MAGGRHVSSPSPDRSRILIWKSTDFGLFLSINLECSMKVENGTRHVTGGLKQE